MFGLPLSVVLKAGAALALLLVVTVLFLRGERMEAEALAARASLTLEQSLRQQDRAAYEAAQQDAQQREALRLATILEAQEENHDETLTRFGSRLADLDRELGRLRVPTDPAAAGRPTPSEQAAALSDAARGPDASAQVAYAPCDRDCLASLIQLDELITFVETSAASWASAQEQ